MNAARNWTCAIKKKSYAGKKQNEKATWKSDKFWLGKILEYPEIMTQGETLKS
jgi:hypothetical protein